MRQKSNSSPASSGDACPQHSAGNPEALTRPKRRSALCLMACAAETSIAELCPARRHRREHVLLLVEG